MNKNKKMYIIMIVLVVIVAGFSIAYAVLSTTLTITGNVTQNALQFGPTCKNETVSGTFSGTSTTGSSCGNVTCSGTTFTVAETKLSKPNDKCIWKLTVENKKDINAKLTAIAASAPSSVSCTIETANNKMTCGDMEYFLTTDSNGSTLLTTGGTIAKTNGTQTIYLVAHRKNVGTLNTNTVTHNGAKFTLTYTQN